MKGMHIQIIQPYHGIPAGGEGTMARKLSTICNVQKATRCAFRPRTSSFLLAFCETRWKRELAAYSMGQLQAFPHQLLCFMFFLSFFQWGSTPTLQNQGVSCQQGFRNNSKQLSAKTVQLFLGSRAAMKSS